jgi:Glucose / Sorbosone dehydrogenase
MPKVNRRRIETLIAALVAVGAGIVGIANREAARELGAKFVTVERLARVKNPVYLTQPSGSGAPLFVAQAGGAIRVISDDRLRRRPFLNIADKVDARGFRGEPGMASIAFPPDYQRSGRFYVAYSRRDALVIAQYRRSATDPLVADPDSGRTILQIHEPTPAHHGGLLAFGPDGHLYVATGDGGPARDPKGAAQNVELLRGKVLRIDPTEDGYAIPADNPFVGTPGRDEIWSYGLRNPRGLSFDRTTRAIGIADAGEDRYEEIDYLPITRSRGANFGWSAFEAFAPFNGGVARRDTVLPTIAYRHRPGCLVAGGYLVRDPHLARIRGREIFGDYVFGDYCTGKLYGFRPRVARRAGKQRSFRLGTRYVTSIGQDNSRRIYVLTLRGPTRKGKPTLGSVYRLVPHRDPVPD